MKSMLFIRGQVHNMLETLIAVLAIAVILFFAVRYIYKSKKKGVKCIGCPCAGSCGGKACGSTNEELIGEINK